MTRLSVIMCCLESVSANQVQMGVGGGECLICCDVISKSIYIEGTAMHIQRTYWSNLTARDLINVFQALWTWKALSESWELLLIIIIPKINVQMW